jgi:hypothetical protein
MRELGISCQACSCRKFGSAGVEGGSGRVLLCTLQVSIALFMSGGFENPCDTVSGVILAIEKQG